MTAIEWTDVTWNCIRGCSRVSKGCTNCYAEKIAARFSREGDPFHGFAEHPAYSYGTPAASHRPSHPRWTGRVELVPEKLDEPLRWKKPRRVFVNSMSDLFHENLTTETVAKVFAVCWDTPRHTYQILTKRAAQMARMLNDPWFKACLLREIQARCDAALAEYGIPPSPISEFPWPLPNVWLGCSCEDQKTADERIPLLLQTPAAVRFVSLEPLLGPIDLERILLKKSERPETGQPDVTFNALQGWYGGARHDARTRLDWVIVGGESGPGARPCDVRWIRDIVRQCKAAGVPAFVKQLGAQSTGEPWASNRRFSPLVRDRKGGDPQEWPEAIRVREFPGGHP